jgi:hypothetical protein
LLTTRELFLEGEDLHHCVYNYSNSCIYNNRYIFSLRILNDKEEKKLITLEVLNRNIIQAKGLHNRLINKIEFEIIENWAKEKALTLSIYTNF